jgi:transposase
MAALSNKRHDERGRSYYARKLAAGKGKKGALRCLKRRLSDAVYRTMVDAERKAAGPGGHSGAAIRSSAADRSPVASTSDKSLPGPVATEATPEVLVATAPA